MYKSITRALCLLGAIAMIAACASNAKKKAAEEAAAKARAEADSIAQVEKLMKMERTQAILAQLGDEPIFDIVTSMGTIKVKLYAKTPLHRRNFAKLALEGYYDSLLFHRVINGFMIQGGDPLTKDPEASSMYGTGGPDYTVPAEFVPEYRHKKGALAAARRGDAANPKKESSGSQFYLVQDEVACSQLDGAYTVYGETIKGLDVIDKIAAVQTNHRDLPLEPVRIIRIELDPSCMPVLPTEKVEEVADSTDVAAEIVEL